MPATLVLPHPDDQVWHCLRLAPSLPFDAENREKKATTPLPAAPGELPVWLL